MRADSRAAPPVEESPSNSKPILEFGRGGLEHKKLQLYVKECAEKLGFHAEPEKEVLGGSGRARASSSGRVLKNTSPDSSEADLRLSQLLSLAECCDSINLVICSYLAFYIKSGEAGIRTLGTF